MPVPRLYEDLTILHQNTEPVHSYFIPASPRFGASCAPGSIPANREDSDRLQMLSGCEWQFRYFSSIYDLKDEFYRPDYRPDGAWKPETVPFCWQMRGYDTHQYTNIRYPFPYDPPYVPQHNPCGAYLHTFTWHPDPEAPLTFLHFEGVDSCFYVWLNGTYAGYSQVSHHTSEFNVSSYLKEGENVLAVLVLKWCDGSYFEDQDKFRMSGIFRDVYLLRRPENYIEDYVITTDISEDQKTADLRVQIFYHGETVPTRLTLSGGPDNKPFTTWTVPALNQSLPMENASAVNYRLTVTDPLLWNAETPHLYTLLIETEGECIRERVGFRSICVKDGVVLLNGTPIKFRGINRHESDPVTGAVMTRERILSDLRMIKQYNFNAVRAAHYPNVPYFYQICDELGLYVCDEADNESHGTGPLYYTENDYTERMKLAHERIADNPAFMQATLDRVSSMVLRDRNRPSVLIWSMGNESGYGCTFENALAWTKETDPTRLTHYESAFYMPQDRIYDTSNIDLYGRMYPALDDVIAYLENDPEQPLLLVEYCHSMGNGPGDFREYRELTEKYPRLCGGFVWEWNDHAVFKGYASGEKNCSASEETAAEEKNCSASEETAAEEKNCSASEGGAAHGKPMYWYGGDHGELQHDGNFCLDGLVDPERNPHPGLYEFKNVHRPFRASYDAEKGLLTIRNYLDFLTSDFCEASFRLTLDGTEVQSGTVPLPCTPPHAAASVPLRLAIPEAGRCFLTITYTMQEPPAGLGKNLAPGPEEIPVSGLEERQVPGLEDPFVLGFDEIRIPTADSRNQRVSAMLASLGKTTPALPAEAASPEPEKAGISVLPSVTESGTDLIISGCDFTYRLDTLSGRFTSLNTGGKEILKKPMDFNLWRAPTDNDQPLTELWKTERLDHTVTRAYETIWENEENAVVIRIRQSVAAMSVQPILRIQAEYRIFADGTIRADFRAEKCKEIETLPRLGLRMFLDPALDTVEYYGIGPRESYIDKCRSGTHGLFRSAVTDLHEDYIRPQENGSHWDCDLVKLSSGDETLALTVAAADSDTFSFNASVYTQEELESKGHNYELEPCGSTVLCVDHRMAGIGSKSCGPDLLKEYRVDADAYTFSFLIKPAVLG